MNYYYGFQLLLSAAVSSSQAKVDVYFAPYDGSSNLTSNLTALQQDVALIETVTRAKKAFDASAPDAASDDDFEIRFCVYNLLDESYVAPLIAAHRAGVFVQVMIDLKNLEKPYVHLYDWFKNASLSVADSRNTSQRDLTADQRRKLNLIGIHESGLMHMKMRYYSWRESAHSKSPTRVVVSGSFNPEDGALLNEDTLLVIRDAPTVASYMRAYLAVRDATPINNTYDPSRALNLLFSQPEAGVSPAPPPLAVRHVLLDLVRSETELILLSVYSLRNIADSDNSSLVLELCAAVQRGVAVSVLIDKGQADGESGFAGGDDTLTALRLWKGCGVPVYKCENYNGAHNALHHKNGLFGVKRRRIIWTDTANWSEASMGNGTSHAKPHNAETSLVVDSMALDKGRLGHRFLSNALQLVRKYAYQQACPYASPKTGKAVTANCAKDMKWHQPDWVQENATQVLAMLAATVGVKTWPTVEVTFTAAAAAAAGHSVSEEGGAAPSLHYFVNGEAHGHRVSMTKRGATGWAAKVDALPIGAIVSVGIAALGLPARDVVVDAAFEWNASPPLRQLDAVLDAMSVSIQVE